MKSRFSIILLPLLLLTGRAAWAAKIDWFLQPVWDGASRFSEGLAAVRSGKLWGYINPLGRWVIVPRFDEAMPFREGAAAVSEGGRWGFVDAKGEYIVTPSFDSASQFAEGLAAVKSGGRWGYIDKKGKFVIEPQFEIAGGFSDGCAAVSMGGQGFFIDKTGENIYGLAFDRAWPFSDDRAAVILEGKLGFIDGEGDVAIPPQYDPSEGRNMFIDGVAAVRVGGLWGFIRIDGGWLVEPSCEAVKDFSGGFAAVRRGGAWGFISRGGERAIPYVFDDAMPFSEGTASASLGGRWGYIDSQGAWLSDPVFREAWPFNEGLAAARDVRGLWGYVGRSIVPLFGGATFDDARPFAGGRAYVKIGDKWGVINTEGETVEPFSADTQPKLTEPPSHSRRVVPYRAESGMYGYKREDGVVIIPAFLEQAGEFSEGRAAVSLGGKWWYIALPE